ncbi:MAG: CHASE2 domain-containing protein [Syntrophobacteraceae bacterium]
MPESFTLRDRVPYFIAFLLTVVLILLIDFLGLLVAVDWHTYDLFFRIRGSREPPKNIVIAEIDMKTLGALGRWPIPRKHYADLLDRLELADAVGLDIIFAEPSEDDEKLAASIRRLGNVVLAAYLDPHGQIIRPTGTLFAPKTGHVHVEMDADGIARRIYHRLGLNGAWLQSFASVIHGSEIAPTGRQAVEANELCSPGIQQSEPMTVNYYGRSGTFRRISFLDILNGELPPESFRGLTLLVGVTVHGIESGFVTPFTTDRNRMPGVELHANVLGNMLDNTSIKPVAPWLLYLLATLLTAFFFVVYTHYRATLAFFLCISCLMALTASIYVLFVYAHDWIPPGALWASIAAPFLVCSTLELKRTYRSLVQARKNWEEAFNTIDDGIFIQNRSGDFVRTNTAGLRMLGDFLLQAMETRCTEATLQDGGTESLVGNNGNEPVRTEEWFDEDTDRYYEIKSLRRDVRGQFGGLVHVVRDITLNKQALEEQQRLQIMLIQAQKMEALGTLASGIAHDFNNILTAVYGYTELVLVGLSTEDKSIRPRLEQVLKASDRAKELIAQILTFSRRRAAQRSAMQVAPILKEALKLFKTGMPSSVTVIENFDADCDVEIDPTQMHQVILNLCTNAYHALRETGGTIQVSLTKVRFDHTLYKYGQELRPGAYIQLTVADDGCGIPEEHAEKIFEPYFTTKAEGEGTGLGLAIVQAIVQEYGGVVTLNSQTGKGTSFHIYLPRTSLDVPSEVVESERAVDKGSGHILLVEDDPQTCALIQEMLQRCGYEVESKTNAREALDLFRARAKFFDLVMTDFDMSLMSGIELAEKLLEVRPDLPVLLCTGYLDQPLSESAKAAGIREVIRKPFDSKKLSRTIAALMAK